MKEGISEDRRTRMELVRDAVIYQINLRSFTREGTLAAAEKFLPDVAGTGADMVYLCPIAEADENPDPCFWSLRQKRSLCGNPRNPYRIKDFFRIDPEYGTESDLRSFTETAHKLNLRVMLDLVYMHAGPSFGDRYPGYVKKDGNGKVKLNYYHFCELDFDSAELREYLWRNMEYWVREFGIDAYRCDVGGAVPLDFWVEGRRRVEKIRKPFIMLDEWEILHRPADQDETFDMNYCQRWTTFAFPDIFRSGMPAAALEIAWKEADAARPGAVVIRALEHHDTANDMYYARAEKISSAKCEAAYVLCYTVNGVPFLYNGCEYCDTSRHSIFSLPGQFFIDRSKDPAARSAFLRRLADLHRTEKAIREGSMEWLMNSKRESLCTYRRTAADGESVFCAINLGNGEETAECPEAAAFESGDVLLARASTLKDGILRMAPNGYLVLKRRKG